MVAVASTLKEFSILWREKKLLCQSCISQTPTPKAYNWKWINIWSEVVMQGEDFGSMKEAVDMSQMISTLL